jgi:hypothetical protein
VNVDVFQKLSLAHVEARYYRCDDYDFRVKVLVCEERRVNTVRRWGVIRWWLDGGGERRG